MDGNIVVDGVLASCYAKYNHDMAHITMAPIRWFPGIINWIFGEDSTYIVFAKIGGQVGKIVVPDATVCNM